MLIQPNDRPEQEMEISHEDLCRLGAQFLRTEQYDPVLVEHRRKGKHEQPDVIGWVVRQSHAHSAVIECKVTREDYHRDHEKDHRHGQMAGMGNQRYYLVPQGLVSPEEVPREWGLLTTDGEHVFELVPAPLLAHLNLKAERHLLAHALRSHLVTSRLEGFRQQGGAARVPRKSGDGLPPAARSQLRAIVVEHGPITLALASRQVQSPLTGKALRNAIEREIEKGSIEGIWIYRDGGQKYLTAEEKS